MIQPNMRMNKNIRGRIRENYGFLATSPTAFIHCCSPMIQQPQYLPGDIRCTNLSEKDLLQHFLHWFIHRGDTTSKNASKALIDVICNLEVESPENNTSLQFDIKAASHLFQKGNTEAKVYKPPGKVGIVN